MATIDELYQQSLLGNLPTTLTPYQRIMAQMTPTMNPYTGAGVAIGGYDPALYRRMSGSGLINYGGGGMAGGGGDSGGGSGGFSNPFSDLTQAQQAAYYAANPTMASITQLGQKAFGFTTPGMLQSFFNPGFVSEQGLIAMGVDPATYQNARESFRASEIADMNGGFQSAQQNNIDAGLAAAADAEAAAQTNNSFTPSDSPSSNTPSSDSGFGTGDSYGNSDYGGYLYEGGLVTNVFGPDPAGPDEGQVNIMRGEYVIKKSAVKKYGQGLLDMINDGKIPAKKMKSLLG